LAAYNSKSGMKAASDPDMGIFFLHKIRSVLFIGESRRMTDRENGNTYSDATFSTILVVSKCLHRRQAKYLGSIKG
jgi:hypothetical protein